MSDYRHYNTLATDKANLPYSRIKAGRYYSTSTLDGICAKIPSILFSMGIFQ